MPARADSNEAKWAYSSTETADGVITGTEVMGIHWNTVSAEGALQMARNQGLHDVSIAHCRLPSGEPHAVCIIGEFAIDALSAWVTMKEDLPYDWL